MLRNLIKLSVKDKNIVAEVKAVIKKAYESADSPVAVTKSIGSYVMQFRNRGRNAAKRRHPFRGICEQSGLPLNKEDAHFDEIVPENGYEEGNVRWVCPKANNSGTKSCGKC